MGLSYSFSFPKSSFFQGPLLDTFQVIQSFHFETTIVRSRTTTGRGATTGGAVAVGCSSGGAIGYSSAIGGSTTGGGTTSGSTGSASGGGATGVDSTRGSDLGIGRGIGSCRVNIGSFLQ